MGQLPIHRRLTFAYSIVVVALIAILGLGYTAYANQSTISSLKSELSAKDQIIDGKDNLIQEQKATLAKQRNYIAQLEQKLEERNTLLEKDDALITDLKADLATLKQVKKSELQAYLKELDNKQYGESGWKLTFYSLNTESTGKRPGDKGYGYTASGTYVKEGRTIACPPSLKLGTKVWIEGFGERTCEDRGSAVQGKKIDVYLEARTYNQLMQLGVKRNITVRKLGPAV